jgi:hypothetical protein
MAKKGYTPEQIINKLREAELHLQQGATLAAVSKSIGADDIITLATKFRPSSFLALYSGLCGL